MDHRGNELPDASHATETAESSTTSATMAAAPLARRRPIPRKGHHKSRAGCLVCKRRRVKCDEGRPDCGQCRRLALQCRYGEGAGGGSSTGSGAGAGQHPSSENTAAAGETMTTTATATTATAVVGRPFRAAPVSFGLDDLRFFQHFLLTAYPSLPSGDLQYDFLAHAMLGLGASHLDLLTDAGYAKAALQHRVAALGALNRRVREGGLSAADADAAFAAMLSLTYQAAYMSDGMMDFFTMIRGFSSHLIPDFETSRFKSIGMVPYLEHVRQMMAANAQNPDLDEAIARGFLRSLKGLAPLCVTETETRYVAIMQRVATLSLTDPTESYHEHVSPYVMLEKLPAEEFASLMDPDNSVSRLVLMHLLSLNFVLSRKDIEDKGAASASYVRESTAIQWIEEMLRNLPEAYRPYADWVAGFTQRITFSFRSDTEMFQPFLLHMGKVLLSSDPEEDGAASHGEVGVAEERSTMGY
ncbi:hypothetical protein N3K66_004952 [Trichothecium roseum]|uniref:Uncharacterized protein n=1 Tax=Trichothecium roseum TaxID=47278 RepID=A0ACC0V2S5_9HYPO|nr:hypothetical protein N3K66_004952 [Trichothecium roseum]